MLNQKGQAFSVFELMIAAVVAVAILFVLLPMLVPPKNVDVVRTQMANSLATVKGGGTVESQAFTFEKDIFVTSNDFSDKGFDAKSIIFAVAPGLESLFDIPAPETASMAKYNGATPFNGKAFVSCQPTGKLLKSALDMAGTQYAGAEVPGICEEETFQPCCIVIIKRA